MPWSVNESDGKFCVVKDSDGSQVACHATKAEAEAQVKALYANEAATTKVAFEPFAKFEMGKAISLLPQGRWYRGSRILELTKERLQEIAANFAKGLPRFRVGLNLDHEDKGKVGDVKAIEYMPDGEKGPGIYITDYDMSSKAIKSIEDDGYDGVSAEMIWTLNEGAKYQDPETGAEFDNVLVGVALTPKPFFGHNHVSLYSQTKEDETVPDNIAAIVEGVVSSLKQAQAPAPKEAVVTDQAQVKEIAGVDELRTKLTTDLREELEAANKRADRLAAEWHMEKMAEQKSVLRMEAEAYKAISIEPDEYVKHFIALDPKAAEWFRVQFKGFDAAARAAGGFNERGSGRGNDTSEADQFLAAVDGVLKEEFRGDTGKYGEALRIAEKKHPALARAYADRLAS